MNTQIKEKVETEIVELHQFFQDWFTAELPDTDQAFARLPAALADDFCMVIPSGNLVELDSLLVGLRGGHGAQPGIRIWIENTRVQMNEGTLWLATYEEWQEVDGAKQGRISTALFTEDASAPGGLKWRHVHETYL